MNLKFNNNGEWCTCTCLAIHHAWYQHQNVFTSVQCLLSLAFVCKLLSCVYYYLINFVFEFFTEVPNTLQSLFTAHWMVIHLWLKSTWGKYIHAHCMYNWLVKCFLIIESWLKFYRNCTSILVSDVMHLIMNTL